MLCVFAAPSIEQGYAPVNGDVLEVEVWGLGGKAAQEQQQAYRRRENLFIEQRRKVTEGVLLNSNNEGSATFDKTSVVSG